MASPDAIGPIGLIRRAAAAAPDRTAVTADGATGPSWSEFDARVDALAAGLRSLPLAAGERVVLQLGNGIDLPLAYFAVLLAGLIAVPVDPRCADELLHHIVSRTKAVAIVTSRVQSIEAAPRLGLRSVIVPRASDAGDAASFDELAGRGGRVTDLPGPDDIAAIVFTGKSGIHQRGAALTHRALGAAIEQARGARPPILGADDVVLVAAPLFHPVGLMAGVGLAAATAATVVLPAAGAECTLAELADRRPSVVVGVPLAYAAWAAAGNAALATAFASVRRAISAGAPLPAVAAARIAAATTVTVRDSYGLAEAGPLLTLADDSCEPGSVGRPLPGVELELRDDRGFRVDDGDPGEIVVRSASLFSGYWPNRADRPADDGWFATGDLGYLDVAGGVHLVGRRQDRALVRGFPVYPAEVEAALTSHPGVAEAAVVTADDAQAVRAFVVPRPGVALDVEDLRGWTDRRLAAFKRPAEIWVVDVLPHSATGKVRRPTGDDR